MGHFMGDHIFLPTRSRSIGVPIHIDGTQSSPEAIGSPEGYVVPQGHCSLWPHPKLSTPPTNLWIIWWVFVLRPCIDWYREAPQTDRLPFTYNCRVFAQKRHSRCGNRGQLISLRNRRSKGPVTLLHRDFNLSTENQFTAGFGFDRKIVSTLQECKKIKGKIAGACIRKTLH